MLDRLHNIYHSTPFRSSQRPLRWFLDLRTMTALSPEPPYSLGPAVLDAVHGVGGVAVSMPEAAAQSGGVLVLDRPGDACTALPCRVTRLAAHRKHKLSNKTYVEQST